MNCEDSTLEDSILQSVKTDLGITEWDDAFDQTIIRDINTVFMILNQLGVGPTGGFRIEDASATWDDYDTRGADVEGVKTYISTRVKLMFDKSQSSFVNEADKEIADELGWRLNVAVDPG